MKNKNSTKRALVASIMSLIVCVTMFVGATFAWFTDSASTGVNKIQAGTLDVGLNYAKEFNDDKTVKTWGDATNVSLFDTDNMEPGYMTVAGLQVKNEGNLALKWKATLNSSAKLSKLADVIDVYVKTGDYKAPANREEVTNSWTNAGTLAQFVAGIETTTYGSLAAKETADLGLALVMSTNAGNEYQGLELGDHITVTIVAAQDVSENDSFDNQYDKDAVYADIDVTREKFAAGIYHVTEVDNNTGATKVYYEVSGSAGLQSVADMFAGKTRARIEANTVFKLASDIDMTGVEWTPMDWHTDKGHGAGIVFDGQGHTISNLTVKGGHGAAFISRVANGSATIKDLTFDNATVNATGINAAVVVGHNYADLTLDNVDVKKSSVTGNYKCAPLVGTHYDENKDRTRTLTVKDCDVSNTTVIGKQYGFFDICGVVAFVYEDDSEKVVFENSSVKDVVLKATSNSLSYDQYAAVYHNGEDSFNNAEGVTVTNVDVYHNDTLIKEY